MINVLNIITISSPIGGAQMVLKENVLNNSFNNIVITGNDGILANNLRKNGVKVIILKHLKRNFSLLDIIVLYKIIGVIKKEKVDFVVSHSSKVGVLARFACFLTNTKNGFTVHGWSFSNDKSYLSSKLYLFIEKFMKIFSDHYILVSKYDQTIGVKNKIISINNSTLIYNGSQDLGINKSIRDKSEKIIISFVARFSYQKDHETLFKALSFLNTYELNKLTINLIGDGDLYDEYFEKSTNMNLNDSLNFTGETENVGKYLKNSDFFMLISNYEGLPVSIIEALSVGLPIIASDVGGVNELVKDKINGFLVPKNDEVKLSEILKDIIRNKSMNLKNMRDESRLLYELKFKNINMTNKTEELISNLVQKNKSNFKK
jgi:glycosyltransferase involved in cell wall biosynthesis